ncbi:MAG: MBL fold metallo-hydrolase, partial [Candidatus Omnitrophica bacterium]|nr:MBL fold metallo-hydrolase [Candidatus Omnitrophota bacterium]
NKEEEAVTSIIEKFRQMNIEKVAPMHCTGQKAVELFAKEYGNNFIEAKAGMVIEV